MSTTISKAAQLLSRKGHEKQFGHMSKEEKSEYFRKLRVNNMPGGKIYKHVCKFCNYHWESKLESPKQCAWCKKYFWKEK